MSAGVKINKFNFTEYYYHTYSKTNSLITCSTLYVFFYTNEEGGMNLCESQRFSSFQLMEISFPIVPYLLLNELF